MNTERKTMPLSHPAKFIGTWFGVGLMPKAPGTWGSIAALPFAYLIQIYLGNEALFIASIIAFVVGWIACDIYLPYTDAQDPREMVIDEVAGQWMLCSVLYPTFNSYIIALMLFRFFDIVKPWPISVADRKIHGGFGVMFDDILAAIYPIFLFVVVVQAARLLGHPVNLGAVQAFLIHTYDFGL